MYMYMYQCIVCTCTCTVKPVHSGHLETQYNSVLIMKVSIFQRFINTYLYCIGTATTYPDYRGVLIFYRVSTIAGLTVQNNLHVPTYLYQ